MKHALRKSARGQPCMIWLPGCSPGPENETVVLCHGKGGGIARKQPDWWAVLGCASCHSQLDGPESNLPEPYDTVFMDALRRTWAHWEAQGIIKI